MFLDARIYGLNPIGIAVARVLVMNGKRCDIVDFGPLGDKNRIFGVELTRLKVDVNTRENAPAHKIKVAIVTDPTRPKLDILAALQGGLIVRPRYIAKKFKSCPFAAQLNIMLDAEEERRAIRLGTPDLLEFQSGVNS